MTFSVYGIIKKKYLCIKHYDREKVVYARVRQNDDVKSIDSR